MKGEKLTIAAAKELGLRASNGESQKQSGNGYFHDLNGENREKKAANPKFGEYLAVCSAARRCVQGLTKER